MARTKAARSTVTPVMMSPTVCTCECGGSVAGNLDHVAV